MEVKCPAFSSSKRFTLKPNVVTVPKSAPPPTYNLIIGIKSLANIGAILDFATYNLTLNSVKLPMRPFDSLIDHNTLSNMLQEHLEPKSTAEATHHAVGIPDASYEKADLPSIVNEHCKHLTTDQRNKLLRLLLTYEVLCDGTLGDWQTKPISFELKPNARPHHVRVFPVPHIHLKTLKTEVQRLVDLGVP